MEYDPVILKEAQTARLFELVDNVIKSSLPYALKSHNLVVNEVSPALSVKVDKNILSVLISRLLETVMAHSTNSYIRISAKAYSDVMIVHVRDFNIVNRSIATYNLHELDPLVKKIRGFVGVTSHRHGESTVALSFLNIRQ
jgi:hypothetical protein